jgi:serine/threonine-protein kinase
LRGDLDNIALMALRKDPARRYASVAQFSEDIRRHLDGLPVIARKDTFTYRASKFIERHKVGVAAAALVFLAIIAGLTVSIWQAHVAARERDQARQEKAKAEAINNFLQAMLGASSPDSKLRQQKDDLRVKDVLDEASRRLATEDLSGQPEVKAELQRIIGITYLSLGQYSLAEQNLSSALEAQTKIYGHDSLETLKTLVPLGNLWLDKGDHAKAETFYRQKLSILRAEQKKQTISADYLMLALSDFALLRRSQGDSREAELLLREELALSPQGSSETKTTLGIARAVLALTLADQGNFDEAIKIVRTELAAMREQSKDETPELCATLTGLGSFLIEKGELAEAQENLRQAEAIYRRLYHRSNLQLGDNLRLQAQAFYSEHKYAEAEAKINETLEIYRVTTNTNYINFPTALLVQGIIYGETQRTVEAEKLLREAVGIRAEKLPEAHFLRATANGTLGEFLTTQQRFSEAEPLLVNSYESLKKSQGPSGPRRQLALQRLVQLYEKWQRPDLAAKYRATP